MRPDQKAELIRQGSKLAGDLVRTAMSRPRKAAKESTAAAAAAPPQVEQPKTGAKAAPIDLPTTEETTAELKRRLGRELYKAELDLAGGLLIAGKPCDCLDNKHTLLIEAASEELISQDPRNPVYREIIQWIRENQNKVTIEAIQSGAYKEEYPQMAFQFKDFRKRVMGTAAFNALGEPPGTISLEEAKKLAADEAVKEIEKRWKEPETKLSESAKK